MNRLSLSPILYASLFANILFLASLWSRNNNNNDSSSDGHGEQVTHSRSHRLQNSMASIVGDDVVEGQCNINYGNGSCVDHFPGHHALRLTHLVIPFHISHVGRVETLLKSWKDYLPCSRESDQTQAQPAAPFHLVFYSSTDVRKREKIVEIEQRVQDALQNLTTPVLRCFQSFEFHHANLSGPSDKYYRGTKLMIEKLLLGKVKLSVQPQYIYYMEPDVQPIRSNWLNALDAAVRWPNAQFWMKGSLYRGNNKGVYSTRYPPQYYHINGCSLYNLADRAFRSFYVKHYRPFVQEASKVKERSYDTEFFRFMHSLDQVEVARNAFHRFVYSDVVQNYWRSSYSVSKIRAEHPNTFLVHGGYQKP